MTNPYVSLLVSLLPTLFMAGCVFLAARKGGRS